MTIYLDYVLQVCFPVQGDGKPLMVMCLLGPWVASSDKALCLINTLTAALSGQSHSSSLLKWLRKSLWPFGDWYSNFPPASQMICPEMKQTECDCLSLSLSFSLSHLFPFLSILSALQPHASLFPSPPFPTLRASLKCNITCIFDFFFFFSLQWSLKITLAAGNADFCFSYHFSVNNETLWLVKTGFW